MASRVELCDVLTEHKLTRDELNIPCPAEACNSIATRLDRWELLASFLGLTNQDCTAIRENHKGDYALQRSMSLTTWRERLGSRATYLELAKGLEKIGRLDLVGELCVLYVASQDAEDTKALAIRPKDNMEEIISRFELRFEDLAVSIFREVREGNKVSVEDFRFTLTLLPLKIKSNHFTFIKENIPELMKASNLQEIFMHLNLYWNCFNYKLLEVIVNKYGSENLKMHMMYYDSDMQDFFQKTTVADFIPYCKGLQRFEKVPEGFEEVKTVINKQMTEITLLELEELRRRFTLSCQLPNFVLILYDLQEGSLEVTWLVATELKEQLKEALRRELSGQLEKEIASISVGGEWIKKTKMASCDTSPEEDELIKEEQSVQLGKEIQQKVSVLPTTSTTDGHRAEKATKGSIEKRAECSTRKGDSECIEEIKMASYESSPKEKEPREIIIAVVGKSGAGKTTLAHKILGKCKKNLNLHPDTKICETISKIKENVLLTIIDNPGLLIGKEKEQLKKLFDFAEKERGFLHLLLYCVPVTLASKFEDNNSEIMKNLQSRFGKVIWKNCVIAFTFANQIDLENYSLEQYKDYLKEYAKNFEEELKSLGVKDVTVKTIFELEPKQNLENVIIAVPVGRNDDDEVIPDRKWLEILREIMIDKGKEECKLRLEKHWTYGAAVGGVVGAVAWILGMKNNKDEK